MAIVSCIKRNKCKMFRRLYMRRRLTTGEYETDWQLIPNKYIKKWGTIEYSIEDIKPNHYKYSGMQISVINNDGYFSDPSQNGSFFYGYLGIHKTLVKVYAGYIDTDGTTEYPTDPLFYGLISLNDTKWKQDNEVSFKINHISQIFEDHPADQIKSLGTTQTASAIIDKIKTHTDGAAVAIFQKYISSTVWNVTATAVNYNMATTTSLNGLTAWELMKKIAEAENYTMYIDNNCQFWFKEFSGVPASSSFHFSGLNDKDRSFGHNIMKNIDIDKGYDKIYNRVRIKFAENDTTTSYSIYNETWNYGDSSSSFRYGVREYYYENTFYPTASAASLASYIFTNFSEPRELITMDVKFVPHLMLMQRCTLTYKSIKQQGTFALWGFFNWGEARWGKSTAYNININNGNYYIVGLKHDIDTFKSIAKVKEI